MGEILTQLGIGGVFAYVILKEVLSFLKSRNGPSPPLREANPHPHKIATGDMAVSFWLEQFRELRESQAHTIRLLEQIKDKLP